MKSRIACAQVWHSVIFLTLFCIFLSCFTPSVLGTAEIISGSVTPRSGEPDDELLFLVTYRNDENKPPEYIRLVVNDKRYELNQVNPTDDVYSDGKDYLLKTKLSKGVHIFYFEASDGETNTSSQASTLRIKSTNEFTHLDVAYSLLIATVIVIIPVVYGIYQLRRLTKSVERLVRDKKDRGKKR